jgi:peptide/nickel transport system substrate-binding protein
MRTLIWLLIAAVFLGCAQPAPADQARSNEPGASQPQRTKRITASVMGEVTSFVSRLSLTQISPPGASAVEQLVNGSLAELDGSGQPKPQLGETVPSLENGLWRSLPDGRMETIWKIRQDARWHDGTPLTADDFVFTTTVDQDRDLPIPRNTAYNWVELVEATDPKTVRVVWSRPYIDADQFFTARVVPPLPKHLLEDAYLNDKAQFTNLGYWNQGYVGTGPFTLREHVAGSSIVLQAFPAYPLGRARIDEIEIRVFLDLNTLMTNLISGSIDLTLGRGFTVEQAIQARDQWRDGRLEANPRAWIVINPQFIGPSPAIVTDLQFRRALMHGTNRQELVDSLQSGLTPVAHLFINPAFPEFKEVESAVVRYEYDPRRTVQLIEGQGYTRGPDGIFRDAAGERLAVELRSNGERITEKTIIPVADAWTRLGVATEPNLVPPQRISDREYMATFPGFRMMRQPNDTIQVTRLHSSATPLPQSRFAGSNYARYVNPEFDGLLDEFVATIAWEPRIQILRRIMRHISENLNQMGLFYDMEFMLLNNRMKDVTAREVTIWDAHNWDVGS